MLPRDLCSLSLCIDLFYIFLKALSDTQEACFGHLCLSHSTWHHLKARRGVLASVPHSWLEEQTFNKALGMVDGELQKDCEYSGRVKVTKVPRNQMLGAEYTRLK